MLEVYTVHADKSLTIHVDNCQVSTTVDQGVAHGQSQASGTARHHGSTPLKRELSQCAFQMNAWSTILALDLGFLVVTTYRPVPVVDVLWGALSLHLGTRS